MKGVSPLLASILLVAFTLAVAVIVGTWFTSMSRQQTSAVGGSLNETVTCSKGILDIADIPNNTTVIIHNAGQIDLSGNFTLSCGTNITYPNSSVDLPAGGIASLASSGCQDPGNKIRVSSHVCPSVYTGCTYGTNCPT